MIAEPSPAVPSDPAADFYHYKDVPVGWEYRDGPHREWEQRGDYESQNSDIVEARPPKPKTVMVEITEADAHRWVSYWGNYGGSDYYGRMAEACVKALDEEAP